jgi:hypothetical protein
MAGAESGEERLAWLGLVQDRVQTLESSIRAASAPLPPAPAPPAAVVEDETDSVQQGGGAEDEPASNAGAAAIQENEGALGRVQEPVANRVPVEKEANRDAGAGLAAVRETRGGIEGLVRDMNRVEIEPGRVYHSTQVMNENGDIVGIGGGFIGNHRYQAAGTGRVYDMRRPPPGDCFNCGGRHWRVHCPLAIDNRTIAANAN